MRSKSKKPTTDPVLQRRILKRKIARFSDGVLTVASHVVLAELCFGFEILAQGGGPNPGKVWEAYCRSRKDLSEINYESLKRAFFYLKEKGFIEYVKEETGFLPQITKQGLERLSNVFPKYYRKRPWDGKIYLVTYDIAEEKRGRRNTLREYLKKIGCGMLQASVWITPYNPRDTLRSFIKEKRLGGSVIISDIGKNGNIGQKSLKKLVTEVYDIYGVNNEYRYFLQNFKKKKLGEVSPSSVAFKFFAVLEQDPQLPFELLPLEWRGDEAYALFCQLTGKPQLGAFWEEEIKML